MEQIFISRDPTIDPIKNKVKSEATRQMAFQRKYDRIGNGIGSRVEGSVSLNNEPLSLPGNLFLEYQPVLNLVSKKLISFEAFVRWMHPQLGVLLPGDLLPWMEAHQSLSSLDAWVLQTACEQAIKWPEEIRLGVNVSGALFHRSEANQTISAILQSVGLDPTRLIVEVEEKVLASPLARPDLYELVEMGVSIAIDDVGTKWTSLDTLRDLMVSMVKIDRSFVAGVLECDPVGALDRGVIEVLVRFSHSLGMMTVAEGVESDAQVQVLEELGVDAGQGYLFARPLSSEETLQYAIS